MPLLIDTYSSEVELVDPGNKAWKATEKEGENRVSSSSENDENGNGLSLYLMACLILSLQLILYPWTNYQSTISL